MVSQAKVLSEREPGRIQKKVERKEGRLPPEVIITGGQARGIKNPKREFPHYIIWVLKISYGEGRAVRLSNPKKGRSTVFLYPG